MFGIVEAAANNNIVPVLIKGIKQLECQSDDSACFAVITKDCIERVRSVGQVTALKISSVNIEHHTGIIYTRWATRGIPGERSAHSHVSDKLKEIFYIHAEAYLAGERKNGFSVLLNQNIPVISVALNDDLLEKLKPSLQKVKEPGDELLIFINRKSEAPKSDGKYLRLLEHYVSVLLILRAVPLKNLSYQADITKGKSIEKSRNLENFVAIG